MVVDDVIRSEVTSVGVSVVGVRVLPAMSQLPSDACVCHHLKTVLPGGGTEVVERHMTWKTRSQKKKNSGT